jgi:hypothetical protein
MKTLRFFTAALFLSLPTWAIERISEPVSPSQWDAFLPEPVHPSFASDLGSLQEGRISLGMLHGDLAHLSLSVPGLQIISANTRWDTNQDSLRLKYDPDHANLATDPTYPTVYPLRHRDLFRVAGGLNLSSFWSSLRHWDFGLGAAFTNLSVTNESERKIWSQTTIGVSSSVRFQKLLLSGAWDSNEQRYRIGYLSAHDLQLGLEAYQNLQTDKSYGGQAGGEKTFRESIKFRAGLRWQWANSERVENMMLLGTSIRFRPWRPGVDPEWLKPIVAPFQGIPLAQRFLYDWEFSLDMMLDNQHGGSNWLVSLTRWF